MNLMGHFIKIMMATKYVFPSDNSIYNKKKRCVKDQEDTMDCVFAGPRNL